MDQERMAASAPLGSSSLVPMAVSNVTSTTAGTSVNASAKANGNAAASGNANASASPVSMIPQSLVDGTGDMLPPPLPVKTPSTAHSELRVVTNLSELGPPTKWPGVVRSPTSILLSPIGTPGFKATPGGGNNSNSSSSSSMIMTSKPLSLDTSAPSAIGLGGELPPPPMSPTLGKDLQFDPRFLADTWSQESPQSVYAFLTGPHAQMHSFSPLAISPGGARLMSPIMGQHNSQQQQHQLFTSQLQGLTAQMSPVSGLHRQPFYPPTVSIPPSPHGFQASLLSPMFAAVSPGGTLSPDVIGMVDPSTVFGSTSSPTSIIRHLLPPAMPRTTTMNVKDLTLNELRPHFNKPMAVVAKELGVCITLMKKICRRNGLIRWPHRRIRSLVNRITSLQVIASNSAGAEKKRFQSQIFALREELSAVIQNPNEKSRKAQADAKSRSPPVAPAMLKEDATAVPEVKLAGFSDDGQEEKRAATAPAPAVAPAPKRGAQTRATRGKRKTRATPPPPIKIPRLGDVPFRTRRMIAGENEDDLLECPSSTTSTGSNGKRGSISSILC